MLTLFDVCCAQECSVLQACRASRVLQAPRVTPAHRVTEVCRAHAVLAAVLVSLEITECRALPVSWDFRALAAALGSPDCRDSSDGRASLDPQVCAVPSNDPE